MWWSARLDTKVYTQSDLLWKVAARLKPWHLHSDILRPGTHSTQSHRMQLAPLSKWLTSVTHPIALEEKTSPWVDFAGLNENKICNWKAEVVHEACCKCRYWDGKKIDCSPVRVTCFASQSQGEQISDRELLKALAISSEKKTKSNPNLAILASCRSKYRFLMDIWQRKCIKLNLSSALVHRVMTV